MEEVRKERLYGRRGGMEWEERRGGKGGEEGWNGRRGGMEWE